MNEREHEDDKLAALKLNEIVARREHRSLIATAVVSSSTAFASLPMAIYSDNPSWVIATMATVGALIGTLTIRYTETTQAELKEAKRQVENYQNLHFISRLKQ